MAIERARTGLGAERTDGAQGAFLYCDYWASVLGLRGIVREAAVRSGRIDPPLFRACLDRPETRLPGLRYYVLTLLAGPALIPYRVLQHARSKLRLHLPAEDEAAEMLAPCALAIESQDDGGVRVRHGSDVMARDLFDPQRAEVIFSLVYPTYKLLFSALAAIALTLGAQWALHTGLVPHGLEATVRFAHYPLVVLLSWLVFRDGITAVVAPLPVYVVVGGLKAVGELTSPRPELFLVALLAVAVAYFLVDGFLVPKGLAPALYYYCADPSDDAHPYEPGQAPAWLAGRSYWVWRFTYCTAAELNKFWERDWERVEVWVHADGPQAGEIEWLVFDFHYRELWVPKDRLVSARRQKAQTAAVAQARDEGGALLWTVETDMNIVFHSPEVRSIHVMPVDRGWRPARLRQLLASLRVEEQRDRPHDYRDGVRRLRAVGHDVVADIPEHFRGYALRQLLTTPWRYWRYARGANTALRPYLYSRRESTEPLPATEPDLQLKSPRQPEA